MSYMYRIFFLIHVVGSENIKMFVLDEADELLSRGFRDQIYDLLTMLPGNMQVIVVSATMLDDLLETTAKLMNDPVKILTKIEERTLEGIRQFYVNVEREVDRHTCHSMAMNCFYPGVEIR
jgi:translation initiation factor 4A